MVNFIIELSIIDSSMINGGVNMNLQQWFEKGLTTEQYLDNMKVHKEGMLGIYNGYKVTEQHKEQLSKLPKNMKVIVIAEDWCDDAMVNSGVLLRIAEQANFDVRFILRDTNLELMDQYLTNGTARSIPIFIFMDEQFNEVAVWGPRAAKIQKHFEELKATLPEKDAPDYKEKWLAVVELFVSKFTTDNETWQVIATSIIEKLSEIK